MMLWLRDIFNAGWVGSAIGLIGLVLAIYFFWKSRVAPRPVYQIRTLRLISPHQQILPEEVEIRYEDKRVERLTKTLLVFWNAGNMLIRGADIVTDDPIRCEFSAGSRILRARIVKYSRSSNKLEAKIELGRLYSAVITFDYLDPDDGAIIEFLHTDTESPPTIGGTIRGIPNGIQNWGRVASSNGMLPPPFRPGTTRQFLWFGVFCSLFTSALVCKFLGESSETAIERMQKWLLASIFAANSLLALWVLWRTRRRFPKDLRGLDIEE